MAIQDHSAGPRPISGWPHEDPYRNLRGLLSAELAELPAEELDEVLSGAFGEGTADVLEDFWKKLGRFGKSAGKQFLKAAPTIASTAMTGLSFTPMGLLAGGATGLLGAAAKGAAAAAGRHPAARGLRQLQGALRGGAGKGRVPLPTGSPAATQLLRFMSRPEVSQAIAQMALGTAGRHAVNAGPVRLPVGAIANTLGRLTEAAAEEYHALTAGEAEATPAYLLDAAGEFVSDPADPVQRAAIVLQRFEESDALAQERDSERVAAEPSAWRRSPMRFADTRWRMIEAAEQDQEIEAELELAAAYGEEDDG